MTVGIGVTGATGRMGREVIAAVEDHPDCEIALAVNRDPDGETVDGVEIEPAAELADHLDRGEVDVVIDFTGPESALAYAEACSDAGVAFVTGTTGFTDAQFQELRATGKAIPVLHAPNFSRGVQALVNVVGRAVSDLPGYDVEVVEAHHNGKRDAPSGTANRLVEEIETNGDFSGRTHGREGEQPREAGEIGIHALRAGDVSGEHEVILAGNHEVLRLGHRAEDRSVFAVGAVDAAVWIADRDAGWYDFSDAIAE
ncbi:4-hydroxy-tetrahydrodipicolinate reductase [Halobacteria archaeon AArc-dxtr1]|nr:4-hydroxy-tetrahydrodipicolinate reductase [Halobacteria archaeon AArc-dxtr1]